jgi:hypothetical protein
MARIRNRVPGGLGSVCADYFESEHCFNCFVGCVRLFSYGVGAVGLFELVLLVCGVADILVLSRGVVVVLASVGALIAFALIVLATAMGDRYQNFLNRYKICDVGHKDGKT